MIAGIVLAAGPGRRFGGTKQLAGFEGRPMLEHALATLVAAPVDERVVVLGARAGEIAEGVDLQGVRPLVCEDWEVGQSASLRAGLAAVTGADAVVVSLGDQPRLAPEAFARVIDGRGNTAAVRASYGGVPGHPVLLESALFGRVAALTGDAGARDLLEGVEVATIACDGLGSAVDVDTPERLAALEGDRS